MTHRAYFRGRTDRRTSCLLLSLFLGSVCPSGCPKGTEGAVGDNMGQGSMGEGEEGCIWGPRASFQSQTTILYGFLDGSYRSLCSDFLFFPPK